MKVSDEIREHVIRKHFEPAKAAEKKELTLRAGDIHKELGLEGRMPAVCRVWGSNRLEKEARVHQLKTQGPHNGSNGRLTYAIL